MKSWKNIYDQADFFQRDRNPFKIKKQIEILELNNSRNEMKNAIESICSKVEQMEDRKNSL